jgi:hypothetical protein
VFPRPNGLFVVRTNYLFAQRCKGAVCRPLNLRHPPSPATAEVPGSPVPTTGELLTPRDLPRWGSGEPRPAHYLDYFHCGLTLSPDGAWLVDDGWVWHPMGMLKSFSLRRWLQENV